MIIKIISNKKSKIGKHDMKNLRNKNNNNNKNLCYNCNKY